MVVVAVVVEFVVVEKELFESQTRKNQASARKISKFASTLVDHSSSFRFRVFEEFVLAS